MNDKEFLIHLQKQLERDRSEQGLTTMQALKQRQRETQKHKQNNTPKDKK